ncbi:NAD(P)H-binding protein [Chryseolinea serpens]|uniref:NAD(P)H-binding protein n=1 Tax=Chryseolinea serpens TaxID=947013 RepID=UPI00373FD826
MYIRIQKRNHNETLILGAAGQIGKTLTDYLLKQTNHELVLYARNANRRLKVTDPKREKLWRATFLMLTSSPR